ncbi:uncharacterized protein K460DRAFT_413528 [Cucurbitaria berberidis CBS 394.84]|uniref:Rhodopsin domain-containing protein n=1 Tax=Cucurbitaria berberidis CBS 394.84 TaxID=1168544 RepID=A0A9P4LDM0_9PLEO|nr:uncharacterized protein K460DRAFT_413528 [Cucurbitaria berberidis CBS 394.84]KAF1852051.1 hypothetical protein K460DRAFT_413528 [Cucurbitaria berberidis CBS 394.84]
MEAILEGPALNPPPGVVPNFAYPGGSQSIGYGIVIASSIISTIAVLARLVSSTIAKKFVLEDALMAIALGIFAGNQYITYDLSIYPGVWAHQWNIQNRFFIHFLYNIHLGAVYYGPIAMCIKVAILVNWLRIFVPTGVRNATFWMMHILIWVNVVFYTITTFTEIFRCWPREKIWNPWFEGGSCPIDVETQNIATSVLNFISDTTILAMPQWIIWNLHLSRKRKWGISLLFGIGVGAWTFGVVRTVYFVKLLSSEDVTYQMSGVAIWTIWEVTTGFLIMGIPAFPRVAKSLPIPESVSSFFRSLSGYSGRSRSQASKPKWQVMYKPKSRRRRSLWEISELNTHDLVTESSAGDDGSTISPTHAEMVETGSTEPSQLQTV